MKLVAWLLLAFVVVCGTTVNAWQYHAEGHLDNSATVAQHPSDMHRAESSGILIGSVVGNADFDLYLYKYEKGMWKEVAKANNDSYSEILFYQSEKDAWYAWFVVLKSPNTTGGDYSLMLMD